MALIVWLALSWLIGIGAAAQLNQPWWAWLAFGGLAAASLALLSALGERRLRLPLICALLAGLGALRYELARPPLGQPGFVATYAGQGQVTLEGTVVAEPEALGTRTSLRLRAERLYRPGAEPLAVSGLVLVQAPRYSAGRLAATGDASFHYGDRLSVTGALEAPAPDASLAYRTSLARTGIYAQMYAGRVLFNQAQAGPPVMQALFDLRVRALSTLHRIFPQPHAGLLAGILLGSNHALPRDLQADLAATSTTHIIAISGFNIAILAGVVGAAAFRLLGRGRGTAATILVLAAYTLLVGASGSVVRAALMGSLAVIARQIGRRALGLNTLAATAVAMTLANPLWLWDVGFQLSAAATLGLVLYATPLQDAFQRLAERRTNPAAARRLALLAGEAVLVTLAAQITTFPLTVFYFQRVSPISLLANFIILPVQPAVMMVGGMALVLGLVWLPLGQLAAWLAWPFTAYTLAWVQALARVPGASFYLGPVAPPVVAGMYALLFGLTWLFTRPAAARPAWIGALASQRLPGGGLVLLSGLALLTWGYYFSLPDHSGRLRVTVLAVEAGQAVLVQAPGGGTVLIDGGPNSTTLARALAERLPLFANELDALVVASTGDDDIGAVPELLERYRVKRAVVTSEPCRVPACRAALARLAEQGTEVVEAATLPALDLSDGIRLSVLADGEAGSALRLEWQRFALLMPIGLAPSQEAELLARGQAPPTTALLLPDGGAEMSDAWLTAINPQLALVTVGRGQPPSPEALARLAGRNVLRTDQHGAIMVETDGQQLWVSAER